MKKALLIVLALILVLPLVACKEEAAAAVELNMEDVYKKLVEEVALPPMLELPADLALDLCGIKAEDVT